MHPACSRSPPRPLAPPPGSPHEYVRPRVTRGGPLAITGGRHPLLEALLHHRHGAPLRDGRGAGDGSAEGAAGGVWGALPYAGGGADGTVAAATATAGGALCAPREYAPNDTYVSQAATLHLITGPNMAGKSTYLKQVGSGFMVGGADT